MDALARDVTGSAPDGAAMLDGVRVLDLSDERGNLAAMILAGLGADVVAVEPPEGQPARHLAPFDGDVPGVDRSLVHWAANRGKRSVALDVAGSVRDRDRFRSLVAVADVLFETAPPTERDRLGLGVTDLARLNPALVHVSITGFGSTGPKATWSAPDLVALAAGGSLLLSGDADRPPVRCSVPQAWAHTSGDAADAALIALWERRRSGLGQHCDVSAQQSVMQATQCLVLNHAFGLPSSTRVAGGMRKNPYDVRVVWPCKDGTVSITFVFGASAGPFSARLFRWIWEEGGCDEATRDIDWTNLGIDLHRGTVPVSELERVKGILAEFCLTKTMRELFEAAMDRKLLIAPASTIADVLATPHFAERDFWDHVTEPSTGRRFRQPGPIVLPSTGRLPALPAAPRLGAHSEAVLVEWTGTRPAPRPPAAAVATGTSHRGPLAGLKVLDFMWSLAGPFITRVLADHGATVVRIESSRRIEMGRTLDPFWQDKPDVEGSGVYLDANAGKLGVCLDPGTPEGRQVALDLARWADVVTESYSPSAMTRWALDYDHLREVNPSVVMMSSSLTGHTGSLSRLAGFGNLAAALAGFYHPTGWPDRPCVGVFGGYTDYLSPRFAIAALLAALQRRDRTGEGCYLDFSQTESAMWALGPAFYEYEVNGRIWERSGNGDRNHVPHAVVPVRGDDRWVAVVCETDDQWRSLCSVVGLGEDLAPLDVATRRARQEEIEARLAAATAGCDGDDLTARLQAAGVPAHIAADSADLWHDPQLAHRGHWAWVDHERLGRVPVEAPRFTLARTPAPPTTAAPTLGQHTYEVLTELLGYDSDRVADLAAAGVLE